MSTAQAAAAETTAADFDLTAAPSARDQAIYEAICIDCDRPFEVAQRFDLSATTIRNIAQRTQRQLARRQHELDQMCDVEGLKRHYERVDAQLRYVNGQIKDDQNGRSEQVVTTREGTQRRGDEPEFERIVEKTTVTTKKDGNLELRRITLANKLLKDLWAIELQFHRQREERRRTAELRAQCDAQKAEQMQELDELESLFNEQNDYFERARATAVMVQRERAELDAREAAKQAKAAKAKAKHVSDAPETEGSQADAASQVETPANGSRRKAK